MLALVTQYRQRSDAEVQRERRIGDENYVGGTPWEVAGARASRAPHLWGKGAPVHQPPSHGPGEERDSLCRMVEETDRGGPTGYPYIGSASGESAGSHEERTLFSTRGVDFTMFVKAWDDMGIYQYAGRSDLLAGYSAPNIKKPPRKVRVIDIEPCPHDEASATAFVEGIQALSLSAGGICGFHHRYAEKRSKWTLHIVVDSLALATVLAGEMLTEWIGRDRMEVIVDRCQKQLSWFDASVEFKELSVAEVVCGRKRT